MSCNQNIKLVFVIGLAACGGDTDGGDIPDAQVTDSTPGASPCGFEDRYLPFQPGYKWTYKVTDLSSPGTRDKSQILTMENDPELGEVIIQTTNKGNGATVSALQRIGDAVVRLRQLDLDVASVLERTTTYDPGQNRLDEAAENLVLGAKWDDVYSLSVAKVGSPVVEGQRTDSWEVLGVDVDCDSPFGTLKCLQLRRIRTAGGISDKQFFFAKGVGKIKEVNASQIEELVSCGVE